MRETGDHKTRGHAVDRAGALASSACAVHCVVCAFLPGAMAALGLDALVGHEAEWGLSLVAVALASIALFSGWRKHRRWSVALLLAVGIGGLLLSRLLEDAGGHTQGIAVALVAGLVLVGGHMANLRASRRCQTGCAYELMP